MLYLSESTVVSLMTIDTKDGCSSIEVSLEHIRNALYSIYSILGGRVMVQSEVQWKKAQRLIMVTDVGILMVERELQPLKVFDLMVVTSGGIATVERDLQSEKAYSSMLVIDDGIMMVEREAQL